MCEGFYVKEEVLDEWESEGEGYCLVDKGAGPVRLEVCKNGKWVPEKPCYEWAVVIERLLSLKASFERTEDGLCTTKKQ